MQYASREESEHHLSPTLVESRLHAIRKTGNGVVIVAYGQTVYDQMNLVRGFGIGLGKVLLYGGNLSVGLYAHEALLKVFLQAVLYGGGSLLLTQMHGCKHHEACAWRVGGHASEHILHAMLLHLVSADGTEGVSHAGKEHTHVLVYLGAGTHGGARIAAAHLLLYGNSRGNTLDIVTLGLAHTAKELTSITGKALHIAALTLGIQCIEGKAGLARTTDTSDDNELVARYLHIYVLQVVNPGAFYLYAFHNQSLTFTPLLSFCMWSSAVIT